MPHIKVTGFEPMALCTQNRCADQTALHLVSLEHIDRPDRWRLEWNSPLLLGTGTREPIRVIHRFLFKICLKQDRARPKSRIVQERSKLLAYSFFHFSLFYSKSGARRLRVLWTLRPLRSGFEPLTQGFSVLCSNQLSYLNHFPKVCFLHRIAPYRPYGREGGAPWALY